MKIASSLAVGLLCFVAASSQALAAQTEPEIEASVRELLMNRHPDDTPAWWRALGPQAPRVLMRMYPAEPSVYRRMRLLEGLGAFTDDAAAVEFIKQQGDRADEDVIRNDAVKVIGRSQGAREEEWLAKHLKHADPHTRVAAGLALRAAGTEAARARVDQALAGEMLPWVAAKIKGEAPAKGAPLTPAASSEDRLSPDLAGAWRGYWVSPSGDSIRSEAVQGSLKLSGLIEIGGELRVRSKGAVRTLRLARATGKGAKWSGLLVEEAAAADAKPAPREEIAVEAELSQKAGVYLLQVRAVKSGGAMLLRRTGKD